MCVAKVLVRGLGVGVLLLNGKRKSCCGDPTSLSHVPPGSKKIVQPFLGIIGMTLVPNWYDLVSFVLSLGIVSNEELLPISRKDVIVVRLRQRFFPSHVSAHWIDAHSSVEQLGEDVLVR